MLKKGHWLCAQLRTALLFLFSVFFIFGCGGGNNSAIPDITKADTSANNSGNALTSGLGTGSGNIVPVLLPGKQDYYPDEVLVVLNDNVQAPTVSLIGNYPLTLTQKRELRWGTLYRLGITDGTPVPVMVNTLKSDPNVKMAEPNYLYTYTEELYFPNDPMWAYTNDPTDPKDSVYDQWGPAMVGAPVVWNETKGSQDVVVAIIDTGVRFDHEDLHDNLWINEDEIPDDGIDNDLNGYLDDWWGWNCWQMNNDPYDDGSYASYHGTACSGVTAAIQDNERGVSGIAPGIKIMAVKTDLTGAGTYESSVVEALNYVAVNNADIASMSFRTYEFSTIMEAACNDAWNNGQGVILMGAAGNESTTDVCYPNGYESVMAIGATCPFTEYNEPRDEKRIVSGEDGFYWGSNYGGHLNVMAFGDKYTTTYGGHYDSYWDGYTQGFFGGTSNACPMSAGVMALIKSYFPSEDGNWCWQRIEETADDLDVVGFDIETGFGRVNAVRALYGSDRFTSLEDSYGFVPLTLPDDRIFDTIHDVPGNPYNDVQDLFRFTTQSDGYLIIDLDIFTWGENLDIALYSDRDMTQLVDSSTTVNHFNSSAESIFLSDVTSGVEYFLKVYSAGAGNSTTYGLFIHNAANMLYVTGESVIPSFVHQKGDDIPFLKLTCNIGYQATLDEVNVYKHGTIDNGSFAMVHLYKDSNNNGKFDKNDTLLAEEAPPGTNRAVLSGFSQLWYYDQPLVLFVTADLSLSPDGSTISLSLESYKDISTSEGTEAHYLQFPISSAELTIGTDSEPPYWVTTTGAQETNASYSSVTIGFNLANDILTPPVKYNVYYTSDPLPFNIGTADVINDIGVSAGTTTDLKCKVSNLVQDIEWHFVVRVEDQAGNEDTNLVVVSGTPGGSGDPTQPEILESYAVTYPTGLALNDNLLLVAESYYGLTIFDRTDPVALENVGSWQGDYVYSIDCDNNYAYAGCSSSFTMLNLSNPSNPTVTDSAAIGTIYALDASAGWAFAVEYFGILHPIRLADPYNLDVYPEKYIDGYGYPYELVTNGNYMYLAYYDVGGVPINRTDPGNPTIGTQFGDTGILGAYVANGKLYTVSYYTDELAVWNITTDPMNPTKMGGSSQGPGYECIDLVVVGNYAYVAKYGYGIVVFDVTNPASPTVVGDLPLMGAIDIATDGDLFYVVTDSGMLYVII